MFFSYESCVVGRLLTYFIFRCNWCRDARACACVCVCVCV